MNTIRQIINRLILTNKDKAILSKFLSPISDKELDEILYGNSYYYGDQGIGTWDMDESVTINEEDDEISS